jgi:hypothetical protein
MGTRCGPTFKLEVAVGGIGGGASRGDRDTTPTSGLVLELSWRKDGWCLLVNVISKTAKFVLNLPELIMDALMVTLSVAL